MTVIGPTNKGGTVVRADNQQRLKRGRDFTPIAKLMERKGVFLGPLVPVVNVQAETIGGDCDGDATELPGIRVSWDQVVPTGIEIFVQYEVLRRLVGETLYTRIGIITNITTVVFDDFCVQSQQTYEYAVRWRARGGAGGQAVSPDSEPPAPGSVEFAFLFVHLEKDASVFARLDTFRADKRRLRDQQQLAVWGRTKPTMAIGEQVWHQIRIPALDQLLGAQDGLWGRLLELMDQERAQASVVCVRFGRARELYFCDFAQETQRQAQKTYTPDVTFVEVHFELAV